LVLDEQQGFKASGSKQWVLAVLIDFSSSGDSQSPPLSATFGSELPPVIAEALPPTVLRESLALSSPLQMKRH
jgi:hypothetical protein